MPLFASDFDPMMVLALIAGLAFWYIVLKGIAALWRKTPDVMKDATAKAGATTITKIVERMFKR